METRATACEAGRRRFYWLKARLDTRTFKGNFLSPTSFFRETSQLRVSPANSPTQFSIASRRIDQLSNIKLSFQETDWRSAFDPSMVQMTGAGTIKPRLADFLALLCCFLVVTGVRSLAQPVAGKP